MAQPFSTVSAKDAVSDQTQEQLLGKAIAEVLAFAAEVSAATVGEDESERRFGPTPEATDFKVQVKFKRNKAGEVLATIDIKPSDSATTALDAKEKRKVEETITEVATSWFMDKLNKFCAGTRDPSLGETCFPKHGLFLELNRLRKGAELPLLDPALFGLAAGEGVPR